MHHERHLDRRAAGAVLVPAVALLLAGCGDDKTGTTASRTSASPTEKAATSAPPSVSPSASPAAVKAADGSRLKACSDARCEVEVKAGDTIHFDSRGMRRAGFEAMAVKSVSATKVVYDLASGRAEFTQPGPKRTTANVNGMSLTLVRIAGEHVVIRLGGPKPGAFSVSVGSGGMQVTTPGG